MKKILLLILVMFVMTSIQNLQAQEKHHIPVTADESIEIVGKFIYENNGNKTYVYIEGNKLVSSRLEVSMYYGEPKYYLSISSVNITDLIPSKLVLSKMSTNDFTSIIYEVEEDKFQEYIYYTYFYSKKEGKVIKESSAKKPEQSKIFFINFKIKEDAEAFMAKLKEAIGN